MEPNDPKAELFIWGEKKNQNNNKTNFCNLLDKRCKVHGVDRLLHLEMAESRKVQNKYICKNFKETYSKSLAWVRSASSRENGYSKNFLMIF